MRINHLGLEVTRKCNMKCTHCLRGNTQNKNIPLETIDILLDQIDSIGHFCPTGGEPSLNIEAIQYFINGCKKRNISIDTACIITNGINLTNDFVNTYTELYEMCELKNNVNVGLQISNDIYHLQEQKFDDSLVKHLPRYSKREHEDGSNIVKKLHKEGRFSNNSIATVMSRPHPGNIYVNVNGDVIDGCDWSYENQEKHIISRVETLEEYYNLIV